MKLNDKISINKKELKNRIVMPPLVCFNWADDDGFETVSRSEHYGVRASGGTGLIVIEATAISKEGRLANSMLGLWKEDHIPQFKRIADACHKSKSVILVQILHAGFKGTTDTVFSSSSVELENKECKSLSLEEISKIKSDFVRTAIFAKESGLDGVEIHGAHQYLLNQFTSSKINKREDIYGGSLENRARLSVEITREIRKATGDDFIIGYRFGVNDETFTEDKFIVEELEKAGVDFFNVSAGFSSLDLELPKDFNYSPITYMGVKLKDFTSKPTACVFGIKDGYQANELVEKYKIPLVAVGKGILADPNWGNKAINNEDIDICFDCKPRCKYGVDGNKCPKIIKMRSL